MSSENTKSELEALRREFTWLIETDIPDKLTLLRNILQNCLKRIDEYSGTVNVISNDKIFSGSVTIESLNLAQVNFTIKQNITGKTARSDLRITARGATYLIDQIHTAHNHMLRALLDICDILEDKSTLIGLGGSGTHAQRMIQNILGSISKSAQALASGEYCSPELSLAKDAMKAFMIPADTLLDVVLFEGQLLIRACVFALVPNGASAARMTESKLRLPKPSVLAPGYTFESKKQLYEITSCFEATADIPSVRDTLRDLVMAEALIRTLQAKIEVFV